jgi:hypothetical protein
MDDEGLRKGLCRNLSSQSTVTQNCLRVWYVAMLDSKLIMIVKDKGIMFYRQF